MFGYSQGATAESMAMTQLAEDGIVPRDAVHFVFIGDPSAPDGIWPHLGLTPEQVADATATTDGRLSYVDINGDDINGAEAWLNAVLHGGGAGGDPLQTVVDSLAQLIIDNL